MPYPGALKQHLALVPVILFAHNQSAPGTTNATNVEG